MMIRCIILILCMAASGCVNVAVRSGGESDSAVRSEYIRGVPSFVRVSNELYCGGQPTLEGYERLKMKGIRTIVSLRMLDNNEEANVRGHKMYYFHISCKDYHPEEEDVVKFLRIATSREYQPVYVHCREGTDRTGMMVAAYRIVAQDWPREKALAEMRKGGGKAIWDPQADYIRGLDVQSVRRQLALKQVP